MTVPLPTPNNPKTDGLATRKRRRRAPAGGAADDCFTCAKRAIKCDRKRPYCSPCLEVGNECSGYKTQLTWGVGVASRGKLRGLSLPIAKAPPVNGVKKTTAAPRPRAASTISRAQWQGTAPGKLNVESSQTPQLPVTHNSPPFHDFEQQHGSTASSATQQAPWFQHSMSTSVPADLSHFAKMRHMSAQFSDHLSVAADNLSDIDYTSPISQSFPRDDVSYLGSPTIMYAESFAGSNSPVPQSPVGSMMIEHQRAAPTSCPSLMFAPSEPSSSLHSSAGFLDGHLPYEPLTTPGLDAFHAQSETPLWPPSPVEDRKLPHLVHDQTLPWPSVLERSTIPTSPEFTAKMSFLMNYYEHTMCPSMVFVDGPNNPFREHIMRLAIDSTSLQHAICALASCNMRMKHKLNINLHNDSGSDLDRLAQASIDQQSVTEEYQHRNMAVQLLNEQLNDFSKSSHDSVLATILLLCHYRMAESGIAKFHTQFAGVKKILGMRRSNHLASLTGESSWMEALFTYFDAISASINDREAQLTGLSSSLMADAQLLPPGSENLVGCDRELFKTIVKLGRLNLLSQHRPVHNLNNNNNSSMSSSHAMPSRSQSPSEPIHGIGLSYDPSQPHSTSNMRSRQQVRYDGNGFGTVLDDNDDGGIFSTSYTGMSSPTSYDDHRSTFWREWKDARIALQSWEYDPQRIATSLQLSLPLNAAQTRDLGSLSEAFRYAALLYTERLASPKVPSAHQNFRNLVSQVVYYATSLEAGSNAEKFLLWPLFVAGSECVNEMQQGVIRSKCREIMARSGYMNNLAALEVLERLWLGEGVAAAAAGETEEYDRAAREGMGMMMMGGLAKKGPFAWTRCIGGRGVEVEWIMF